MVAASEKVQVSGSMEGQAKDNEEPVICILAQDLVLCSSTSENHGPHPVYSPSTEQEHMQTVVGRWVFIQ